MLGLAAACGYDDIVVRPFPRVRVIVTGDELTQTGSGHRSQVRGVLGPMVPALVETMGGEVAEVSS